MLNLESIRKIYSEVIPEPSCDLRKSRHYSKLTPEKRTAMAKEASSTSVRKVADKYGIKIATLYTWVHKYSEAS
jgi:transposase-like protein